ncbi:MAG: hypothetical protein AAFX93_00640 [Verrucomicrobiota bacterium]
MSQHFLFSFVSTNLLRVAALSYFIAFSYLASLSAEPIDYYAPHPFGTEGNANQCDNTAIGKWWIERDGEWGHDKDGRKWFLEREREKALAFVLYTHDDRVLKLTAQTFPLYPEEPKTITLEFFRDGQWQPVAQEPIQYPGWSAHFRIENWDNSQDVRYRARLGDLSSYEGLIRKDPADKESIVVASMSCNSPKDKTRYERMELTNNLIMHDPDLLFFAGDQNYTHDEHTYGWLMWGVHYAAVTKDRPTITITDDHDIGHGNLWGANGKVSLIQGNADGGYKYPASFVNMVQRCEMYHLPDTFDPQPILQDISVHYTDLTLGGISFAILEDRKFKTGPYGRIPQMGPRPDHINDPDYDRSGVDLANLKLLGDRQLKFLDAWARDWSDSSMKVVLSQTAFCGAVHLHGDASNRLLADLDCNGWPQTGRDRAVRAIRRVKGTHLCGDQHLATVLKHGIDDFRDGPMAFTGPALVNTIYGRWWWPLDEAAGGGAPIDSPLPWVGDYEDGLGNKITMFAYANPEYQKTKELNSDPARENRGDGYGLVRFNKATQDITFECWPRFADLSQGDAAQFEGWPITFNMDLNDGREPIAHLPSVILPHANAVVQLTDQATGELIYCYRLQNQAGEAYEAPIFTSSAYQLAIGQSQPDTVLLDNINILVEDQ